MYFSGVETKNSLLSAEAAGGLNFYKKVEAFPVQPEKVANLLSTFLHKAN